MSVTLTIEGLASGGDAIARHAGKVVFLSGAVPGDVVEAELISGERSDRAQILKVLTPSPLRREAACPHFGACGGCQWLNVSEEAQSKAKESLFYEALQRIGGISRGALQANPLLKSAAPLRYRHRAKLHLDHGQLGFSSKGTHDIVDVTTCLLLEPKLEAALLRLREALKQLGGMPRCTDVSIASDEKRVTAAFHVSSLSKPVLERAEALMLRARLDGVVAAPEEGTAKLFGKAVLAYPATLAPEVKLHGRADLFAQANVSTNGALVKEAVRPLEGSRKILELFSGAGNFTFALAGQASEVTAVEFSGEALELARKSAREAKIANVRFILGDALKVADGLSREDGEPFDALFLDPPRVGCKGIGPLAKRLAVKRVVYVSCDPATLARDAKELVESGFRPVSATPVDMFPQTFHVEGVLVLEAT